MSYCKLAALDYLKGNIFHILFQRFQHHLFDGNGFVSCAYPICMCVYIYLIFVIKAWYLNYAWNICKHTVSSNSYSKFYTVYLIGTEKTHRRQNNHAVQANPEWTFEVRFSGDCLFYVVEWTSVSLKRRGGRECAGRSTRPGFLLP